MHMFKPWALSVSLRESRVSEKAGHALLLLRGQWTSSLFLKDPEGQRRRGGNECVLERVRAALSLKKFLTDPEGNEEEPVYSGHQTLRTGNQYGYIFKMWGAII